MNISPILLAKAFIIMAFVGAFMTAYNMRRSGDDYIEVFCGFIMGAIAGATVLATLMAFVEALIFLFT